VNVYYENLLGQHNYLNVTNIARGYLIGSLYDEMLSNNVEFTGTGTVITVKWDLNYFADSVAVLRSNWVTGHLKVISQGDTVFDRDIVSRGASDIIKLPGVYMVSEIVLTLNALFPLYIGMVYVARRIALPLFDIGFKYKRDVLSEPGRTRYGIVYGLKRPTLRGFDISYGDIDDEQRFIMERYIDAVQYVQPHIVEPYDSEVFPPLYATLTKAGEFGKDKGDGFRWDTSLSYTETN
jgi:hypothetical protein